MKNLGYNYNDDYKNTKKEKKIIMKKRNFVYKKSPNV